MISRAVVAAFFGKSFVQASAKGMKVPSLSLCSRFAEQKKKEPLGSYLTEAEIKEKLQQKQLNELFQQVKDLEGKELSKHQVTLAKLQKQLSDSDKSRIQKISELVNGLSEAEAEYFRYRVFKAVDA